ncbi:leucyl aminopeptidase family protein [Parvularcula lutaonensis]|uniref:Leucyl aminopeptidase family protein n=1 Tax=Parvularcula lutaonensis TaxID=491923 RepID=A0ABV7MEH5_9PROT|nr:leucyl aminopeptidase family protein [Parvularcula lutaonensis]GGY55453.1 leucyl aminopeptidase [Parvularcula lutaonensis]
MPQPPVQSAADRAEAATPLFLLNRDDKLPEGAEQAAALAQFKGELDQMAITPAGVLIGAGDGDEPLALGTAGAKLPEGDYRVAALPKGFDETLAALGFALGAYRYDRYGKPSEHPVLLIDDGGRAEAVSREAATVGLGRDLINTPAEEMGPDALEDEARKLADAFGATVKVHKGEGFAEEFPLIHAVGRAAAIEPRLIELEWDGGGEHSFALVGKGVCFDSGGLNLKPGNAMALMKKDMGGAATSIALARRIMEENLPIKLRLLVPAVENLISGNAFRPGDVFRSRQGQTVEISNTDAEGRLILADALALATEGKPDRILTLATLTGAARVALGPDLPPIYSTEPAFQQRVIDAGTRISDPLWPMPFWDRYGSYLKSDIADVNHAADTPFAGSITAALFLKRFVGDIPYTHIDTFAWVPAARPGRPKGGDVLAMRALFRALREQVAA